MKELNDADHFDNFEIILEEAQEVEALLGVLQRSERAKRAATEPDLLTLFFTDEVVSKAMSFPVTFFDCEGGLAFVSRKKVHTFKPAKNAELLQKLISERNARRGIPTPKELLPDARSTVEYAVHTSQEVDVLARSACDGRTGEIWRNEDQRRVRIYEPKGASHRVEIEMGKTQTLKDLEQLTASQDADFVLTMLYVASALAPPSPLPSNGYAGGWIDLDDVMEKIGWYPSKLSREKVAEHRARLWSYLVYADRAKVVGSRSVVYFDKRTNEQIPTQISSPIWKIHGEQRSAQAALFDDVPLRVEIVISKQWQPLLTQRNLAQYLPMGERLGAIPPNKVAGDWARSIGLVLLNLWRRRPVEAREGTYKPTRRELLTHYTPKTRTVTDLLESDKPRRAVEYWHDALHILARRGFLNRQGEVLRSVDQMREGLPSYGWQSAWLDECVEIAPGPKMQNAILQREQALPPARPPSLLGPKRRGRPRKKVS